MRRYPERGDAIAKGMIHFHTRRMVRDKGREIVEANAEQFTSMRKGRVRLSRVPELVEETLRPRR